MPAGNPPVPCPEPPQTVPAAPARSLPRSSQPPASLAIDPACSTSTRPAPARCASCWARRERWWRCGCPPSRPTPTPCLSPRSRRRPRAGCVRGPEEGRAGGGAEAPGGAVRAQGPGGGRAPCGCDGRSPLAACVAAPRLQAAAAWWPAFVGLPTAGRAALAPPACLLPTPRLPACPALRPHTQATWQLQWPATNPKRLAPKFVPLREAESGAPGRGLGRLAVPTLCAMSS